MSQKFTRGFIRSVLGFSPTRISSNNRSCLKTPYIPFMFCPGPFFRFKHQLVIRHVSKQLIHSYIFWPAPSLAQRTPIQAHVPCNLNKSIMSFCLKTRHLRPKFLFFLLLLKNAMRRFLKLIIAPSTVVFWPAFSNDDEATQCFVSSD
jgi:hypothetical protein